MIGTPISYDMPRRHEIFSVSNWEIVSESELWNIEMESGEKGDSPR